MNITSLRLGTRRVARLALIPIAVSLLAGSAIRAKMSEGRPEDVGLSAERLTRIDQLIQREIDAKQISGAVTLVSRRGQIAHFKAQGLMDVEGGRAMQRDTIFPLASMTKPVTGVAVLMLVEEGKIRLSDPVSRFIPEFRDTKVAIRKPTARGQESDADVYTVPADRDVTVRDLMTHTSGLASGPARLSAGHRMGLQRAGGHRHTGTNRRGGVGPHL